MGPSFCCGTDDSASEIRQLMQEMPSSDTLCFLDNWKQLISVGRAFGTITIKGEDKPLFVMCSKYGSPVEVDDNFFTDPIPYLI